MGIPTHCTMLYGHVETYEERVDHMLRLRDQQDATGGFLAFIPLAFHPENTVFERRGCKFTTGADDLKMIAVSRLLLDNIPNIKAYWIMMGMPLRAGRAALRRERRAGHGRAREDLPGGRRASGTEQKIAELVRFIARPGAIPVQRDTLYNEIRGWEQRDQARPHLATSTWRRSSTALDMDVEEVPGVPTELNRMLIDGRARHRADLVDRVRAQRRQAAPAAASLRRVARAPSTRSSSSRACRSSRCASVAVTPEAATSVVLTKVLLPEAAEVPLGDETATPTRSC